MIVELVAHTHVYTPALSKAGWKPERPGQIFENTMMADKLAEFAGRLCYQSWDRAQPETATNEGYLASVIEHERFFVMEHASASFYVAEVSRDVSHALTQHRDLSFSLAVRDVLPGATEIRFLVTGNMRTWRDVIQTHILPVRVTPEGTEMQQFTSKVLELLKRVAPNTFADLYASSQPPTDTYAS